MSVESNPNALMPACVDDVIVPRPHDLGGFEVRRALPATQKQMVGPFIFFDQMGPALPKHAEETAPDFAHHAADTLPLLVDGGMRCVYRGG